MYIFQDQITSNITILNEKQTELLQHELNKTLNSAKCESLAIEEQKIVTILNNTQSKLEQIQNQMSTINNIQARLENIEEFQKSHTEDYVQQNKLLNDILSSVKLQDEKLLQKLVENFSKLDQMSAFLKTFKPIYFKEHVHNVDLELLAQLGLVTQTTANVDENGKIEKIIRF